VYACVYERLRLYCVSKKKKKLAYYFLRSKISVDNFILAYHKVCTKSLIVIFDRREYLTQCPSITPVLTTKYKIPVADLEHCFF
jgi:hypothetical protein